MTTGKPVTRLEHARHLKQAGLPLNTPVEDRTFSAAYSKHWLPLMDAHAAFMRAIGEFSDTQAPGKLTLAKRRLAALDAATARCVDFMSELDTSDAEQDMHEAALLQFFITERALPFLEFWENAVAAVDAGTALTINLADIPRWTDE